MAAREELIEQIQTLAVVRGRVTLASGKEADYYVDLRRATLHHEASPLIGALLRELTADWDYVAVGGLTLGADPIANAVLHASVAAVTPVDAFVVRKEPKDHGRGRQVEGAEVAGKRVVIVEDTSTTGGSPLKAAQVVKDAGADVVAIVTVVDRKTGAQAAVEAAGFEWRSIIDLDDLGLAAQ